MIDNAPYHVGGYTNPFATTKRGCQELLLRLKVKKIKAVRDGVTHWFEVPTNGEFAYGNRGGPKTIEVQRALYQEFRKPRHQHYLQTWVEKQFAKLGWEIIWGVPGCPAWMPIEILWAVGKNNVCRNYFKKRTFERAFEMLMEAWEQKNIKKGNDLLGCDVPGMIRKCEECMNLFIKNDGDLGGTIDNLIVPDTLRDLLIENDPKYTTPDEMAHIMGQEDASIEIPLNGEE